MALGVLVSIRYRGDVAGSRKFEDPAVEMPCLAERQRQHPLPLFR